MRNQIIAAQLVICFGLEGIKRSVGVSGDAAKWEISLERLELTSVDRLGHQAERRLEHSGDARLLYGQATSQRFLDIIKAQFDFRFSQTNYRTFYTLLPLYFNGRLKTLIQSQVSYVHSSSNIRPS
jgi:hypothetical protein